MEEHPTPGDSDLVTDLLIREQIGDCSSVGSQIFFFFFPKSSSSSSLDEHVYLVDENRQILNTHSPSHTNPPPSPTHSPTPSLTTATTHSPPKLHHRCNIPSIEDLRRDRNIPFIAATATRDFGGPEVGIFELETGQDSASWMAVREEGVVVTRMERIGIVGSDVVYDGL
ncbi:hypothetical protein LWI29_027956 [Acer saccharum]|uniref:Uncharacterized protein n=1 Tax=Acer saccharum TaxID=4024 RepID=A0AA39TDF1_ACESA|nr:hypothetical protein LWI29_027956 [Acer saccharum]